MVEGDPYNPETRAEIDRLAALDDEDLVVEIYRLREVTELWTKVYAEGPARSVSQVDLLLAEVLDRWTKGWMEDSEVE